MAFCALNGCAKVTAAHLKLVADPASLCFKKLSENKMNNFASVCLGWRIRKKYFLVKNKEQPKERCLLSWVGTTWSRTPERLCESVASGNAFYFNTPATSGSPGPNTWLRRSRQKATPAMVALVIGVNAKVAKGRVCILRRSQLWLKDYSEGPEETSDLMLFPGLTL